MMDSFDKALQTVGLLDLQVELVSQYGDDGRLFAPYLLDYATGQDCEDNLRICKIGSDDEDQYWKQRDNGCCGFFDTTIQGKDGWYKIGFNFGH